MSRYLLAGCIAVCMSSAAISQDLQRVVAASQAGNTAAQASQQRIDTIVDKTRDLAAQFSATMKEVDGLKVYNELYQRQVNNQVSELGELDESIAQVSVIERQVIPLMIRMIDGLEQFINLDVPFLMEERRNRVASLKQMMERADVSAAEKFRRVLESYQIENEFGRTIEAYKGNLTIDGADREVDFLRVGRIGLYYQTLDGQFTGAWDKSAGGWTALGDEFRTGVRDGLRIARKEAAPNLLTLPISAAEG